MQTWNNYWFRPAPYVDLAVLRLVAVALQIIIMVHGAAPILGPVTSVSQFALVEAAAGYPDELWQPLLLMKLFGLVFFFEWGYRPSLEEVILIYYTTLALGALSLIGLFTNFSLAIFTLGCLFLQAFKYSFGDMHHPEALMMFALIVLTLSPSGKVYSLDSTLWRGRDVPQGHARLEWNGQFAGWAIKLLMWFYVLMYISAVFAKLSKGGLDWPNGFTLQYVMARDGLRNGNFLAIWLSQFHDFLRLSQYTVLVFQATFALAVIFPMLRWIYIPLGLFFHSLNWLALGAPFPQWIALYAVFIPWSQVFMTVQARFWRKSKRSQQVASR